MDETQIAGLRRKHAATQELAKRNELANLLRAHGVDPDAVETVSAAPKGRSTRPLVTAEAPKPAETADVAPETKEAVKETAAKAATPRRRPGRPRNSETAK